MTTQQAFEIARRHQECGQLREAEEIYRRILSAEPDHADALHHLAMIAYQVGKPELAAKLIRRVLVLQPDNALALGNLGEAYRTLKRMDDALQYLRRALELQPDLGDALNSLGVALTDLGRLEEAIPAFHRALAVKSSDPYVHSNLALVLIQNRDVEEALARARRAVEIDPSSALAHNVLGAALAANGQWEEAIAFYRRAISLQPDDPNFHWNVGLALLSIGRLREGWEEFEWRVQRSSLARPNLTMPTWGGEALAGRTLLIHQEGGFGDVLHFIRYLPMILNRNEGKIIFEGEGPILSLMRLQPGIAAVYERGQPLPACDFHCPPQSLPRLFGTELSNIPATIPYLVIDDKKRARWRQKLSAPPCQAGPRRQFLVGLCWAGSTHAVHPRSHTLETFAPLAQVSGVTFVSLQKGPETSQSVHAPAGMRLVDAAAEVEDFSDLAALVANLDAVATVDTAVAHLAGALGIPTWVLIPRQSDFRWLIEREDSPWYPTMRLFRQRDFHSWEEPIQQMAEALRASAESAALARLQSTPHW